MRLSRASLTPSHSTSGWRSAPFKLPPRASSFSSTAERKQRPCVTCLREKRRLNGFGRGSFVPHTEDCSG